nr:PEGA domain-containing protein [Deltaproteobacteria bacterium]
MPSKLITCPKRPKVYLNDTQLEKPFSAKGKKGSHLLRIEAEGYNSWYKTVKLLEPNLNLEYDGEKVVKVTKTFKKPKVDNKHKKKKYRKPSIK